jgi:hypothetical protein
MGLPIGDEIGEVMQVASTGRYVELLHWHRSVTDTSRYGAPKLVIVWHVEDIVTYERSDIPEDKLEPANAMEVLGWMSS